MSPVVHLFRRAYLNYVWVFFTVLLAACNTTLTITSQPASQTVNAGQNVVFSVTASSKMAANNPNLKLNYQWYRDGKAISGAVGSTYALTAAIADNGAQFYVVVSDPASSLQSNTATLTVNSVPQISLLAGSIGGLGYLNGTGSEARFAFPSATAVDAAGNVYVADTYSHTIRKISSAGVVSLYAGVPGVRGWGDGAAASATFYLPQSLAIDASGNLYVGDAIGAIRKITPSGIVSTFSGADSPSNFQGPVDGTGTAARFCGAGGMVFDAAGNLFVSDTNCHTIRKITTSAVVSTVTNFGNTSNPMGIAVDATGNIYVSDVAQKVILKVSATGSFSTLAGSAGVMGSTDGIGSAAHFINPTGLILNAQGNLIVADGAQLFNLASELVVGNTIRQVTPAGVVTTIAGVAGVQGNADGIETAASFRNPTGLSIDPSGNIYISDNMNCTIRKMSSSGAVSTLAGLAANKLGTANGTGDAAAFNFLMGSAVAADSAGNVYVMESLNSDIRKVTPFGVVSSWAGTAGKFGVSDGVGSAARFTFPQAITADAGGNLYIADFGGSNLRKVASDGTVSTLSTTVGQFVSASGLAVDTVGDIYVADAGQHVIKKVSPSGVITTFAGTAGVKGSADGTGAAAGFSSPSGMVLDASGTLYVADSGNNTIRKITAAGVVTTIAGNAGSVGVSDGTGPSARFNNPTQMGMDSSSNLYVDDAYNGTIRKVTSAGVVTTMAGVPGQIGTNSSFSTLGYVSGLAVSGNTLYISSGSAAVLKLPLQ